jgi:large subunit ribosomal protein L5
LINNSGKGGQFLNGERPDCKKSIYPKLLKVMMDKFKYKNVMEIPKIEKIIINMGVGEAVTNSKAMEAAVI